MPFGLKETDYKLIKTVFQLFPKIDEIIVFGSRAMGTEKPGSDVDLALKGNDIKLDDILKLKHKLEELPIIYDFDIINYATINTPALLEHIDRHGIQFYKKQETPSKWKTYKLGDIASVQTGPFGSQLHQSDYVENGTPIITVEHLGENRILHENLPRITDEDKNRLNKYWLKEGDIVFSRVGSVDRRAYVKEAEEGWLFSGRCLRVRPKDVSGKYLSYFFGLQDFKMKIRAVAVGATMPSLNTSIMNNIEVQLPENISTQTAIAQILSSLDDKIELNLQMNQTLEAMAQAIFKEWFVDFNFPGFDGELVDGLPKGWSRIKMSDLIEIKHGYAFKGEFFSEDEQNDILLTPGNFKIGGGFNSAKFKYYNGEVPEAYILKRDDLVVTMTDLSKAGDTLGYSALVPKIDSKRLLHNQRIGKVLFKENLQLKYYLYWVMRQDDYRHFVLGSATGSTVKHTSPTRICDFKIALPDNHTLVLFDSIISVLSNKQQENDIQGALLCKTRDTLLPKLMSGQLEVMNS